MTLPVAQSPRIELHEDFDLALAEAHASEICHKSELEEHVKDFKYIIPGLFMLAATGGIALAHSGATGIVKERMDMMGEIADGMKIIGGMIKGQKPFDADQASSAAESIAKHAATMPKLFPEGTATGTSEALPAIWQDWDEFVRIAGDMEMRASELTAKAADATAVADIRNEFSQVAQTCSACHQSFRQKK